MNNPCMACRSRLCLRSGRPCRRVERMLPKESSGRKHWQKLAGLLRDGKHFNDLQFGKRERSIAQLRWTISHAHLGDVNREIIERRLWLGQSLGCIAREMKVDKRRVQRIVRRFWAGAASPHFSPAAEKCALRASTPATYVASAQG